jgi:tol-pal system protein YbgF
MVHHGVERSGSIPLWAALSLIGLLLAGCVSPRDIRTLQAQLDDVQTQQERLSRDIDRLDSLATEDAGDTRQMVVDIKHSVSDLDEQLTQVNARLDDMDQRLASSGGSDGLPQVIVPAAGAAALGAAAVSSNADAARDLYQQAFDALKREDHQAAIAGFRSFLTQAPDAPEAASAVFWIGESFYAQGEYDSALTQFQSVLDQYPKSAKVPAALFKSGNIYDERGDKAGAYPYYRRLKEEFPQSLEYQQLRRQLED